jgi:uncharacterized oligopeptide transporter (OPT) family protein
MLMSASNLYTTLSIGWAFGVAITACVMSYVIWTIVRAISLNSVSKMSILENTCMASTASAAGYSTGSTIATMFGALMILHVVPAGQTSADVKTWDIQPVWLVATFTFLTGAMGCFLAIPMKRQMINHEQLPFPSGIAAAETLKSLYSESLEALHKAYALVVSLLVGGIVGILNTTEDTLIYIDRAMRWAKGILGFEPRLPEQIPAAGFMQVQGKPLIGFGFEPSVLLIAAGMIVGVRVCISMLLGSILLYFFVAPYLINMDVSHAGDPKYIPSIELVAGGTIYHVYRWGLWGGTALMVFASLTSLAMQWKTMGRAFGKFFKKEELSEHSELEARMAKVEVPTFWLVLGMVPITIGMVILQYMAFNISIVAGLIAVALSFVLSLVACRATGETDTTPIGAMGKVMQLTFAALHPRQIIPNLASAGIAANSASSSADLLTRRQPAQAVPRAVRRHLLWHDCDCPGVVPDGAHQGSTREVPGAGHQPVGPRRSGADRGHRQAAHVRSVCHHHRSTGGHHPARGRAPHPAVGPQVLAQRDGLWPLMGSALRQRLRVHDRRDHRVHLGEDQQADRRRLHGADRIGPRCRRVAHQGDHRHDRDGHRPARLGQVAPARCQS